jgi:nucleoside-diphosphate-sugar epimerase
MTRRTLVTGASGFVGRQTLGPLVAAGVEVHAAGRRRPQHWTGNVHWHDVDLLDQAARRALVRSVRPHVVLHLAWEATHGLFWTAPSNLNWVAATLELLREASEAGAERFVGVGTCMEYADSATACHETKSPIIPHTLYGVCKDACRRAAEQFAATQCVSFAWARLFLLYGPGEAPSRLLPTVARKLLAGEAAQTTSGRAVRDFMDVRDAGAALVALALSDIGGTVNVASGRASSVRDAVEILGDLAKRPDLVHIGALPDRAEPLRLVASVSRLSDDVGYREARPLEEGLRQVLDYWRSRMQCESEMAASSK